MQKRQIQELKGQESWINGQTPPPGCTIDQHGFATTSTALVAAVQRSIASTSSNNGTIVPLPPTPQQQAPQAPSNNIPPIINTNASTAGSAFGRQGQQVNPQEDNASVSQFSNVSSINSNGKNYNGPIFDSNSN